jgi:ankyrin repeat protein
MYAAEYNENPAVITTLLNAGAKLDDRDKNGMTPLMHAAWINMNPDVITTLLNAGANAKAKSNEGKTAFDYAQNNTKIKGTKAYWDLNNALFR